MILVFYAIAFGFLVLGVIFRVFKPIDVLSGISAENLTDQDGFGKWVGNSLLAFAAIYTAIGAALEYFNVDLSGGSTSIIVFAAVFLAGQGLIVSYVMGTGKFTKQTALPPRVIETEDDDAR